MSEDREPESALATADGVCQRIKMKLRERLTPQNPLEMKSLPFYVRCIKESLLYRSTELAETGIDLYRRNALVSAATITRSLLETTALFERLRDICANFAETYKKHGCHNDDIQKFVEWLRKTSLATTDRSVNVEDRRQIEPFEPSKLVNSLDTRFKFNAKGAYDSLCQMAHPAFQGCMGSFTKRHDSYVECFPDYHHSPSPQNAILFQTLLMMLLLIVESLEEDMTRILPNFTTACKAYSKG